MYLLLLLLSYMYRCAMYCFLALGMYSICTEYIIPITFRLNRVSRSLRHATHALNRVSPLPLDRALYGIFCSGNVLHLYRIAPSARHLELLLLDTSVRVLDRERDAQRGSRPCDLVLALLELCHSEQLVLQPALEPQLFARISLLLISQGTERRGNTYDDRPSRTVPALGTIRV
jgi:hypothetical protein